MSVLAFLLAALSASFKPLLVLFGPFESDGAYFLVVQPSIDQFSVKLLCLILFDRFVQVGD
jgi:hypothetical protein